MSIQEVGSCQVTTAFSGRVFTPTHSFQIIRFIYSSLTLSLTFGGVDCQKYDRTIQRTRERVGKRRKRQMTVKRDRLTKNPLAPLPAATAAMALTPTMAPGTSTVEAQSIMCHLITTWSPEDNNCIIITWTCRRQLLLLSTHCDNGSCLILSIFCQQISAQTESCASIQFQRIDTQTDKEAKNSIL